MAPNSPTMPHLEDPDDEHAPSEFNQIMSAIQSLGKAVVYTQHGHDNHARKFAKFKTPETSLYPRLLENYIGALAKLQQTGSFYEYQTAAERILNRVSGVPEFALTALFIAGLKQPTQRQLNLQKPNTVAAAIALARELSVINKGTNYSTPPQQRRQWTNRQQVPPTRPSLP